MAQNHKLSDIQAKRTQLERAITDLIHKFETETGVRVAEMQIGRMHNVDPAVGTVKEAVTVARVVVVL